MLRLQEFSMIKDNLVHVTMLGDCQVQNNLKQASFHLEIADMHFNNGVFELGRNQIRIAEKIHEQVLTQIKNK